MPSIVRSILAVIAGPVTVVALSEGPDAILRANQGWFGEATPDYQLMTATAYRILAGIAGGYMTALFAPNRAMTHVTVLGVIGFALSLLGVYVNMTQHLGPDWYPIALAVTAFPSVSLGGRLRAGSPKAVQS